MGKLKVPLWKEQDLTFVAKYTVKFMISLKTHKFSTKIVFGIDAQKSGNTHF
jgi:hypothetical protein